jgi:hypothetical protein
VIATAGKSATYPAARAGVGGVVRLAAVLPTLPQRPAPVFAPATPVLRHAHAQRQLSLDLRPR